MANWPPRSVDRLLDDALESVGSVELLLLLRSEPTHGHGVQELCTVLRSPRSWTELELDRLARARLVAEANGEWRYAPATRALADAVDDLARGWQQDSRSVSRWMFAPRPAHGRERR